jgi:2-desacetyl-2-hydroxyethyl bacteriochlorophyllide A dehydrogenase
MKAIVLEKPGQLRNASIDAPGDLPPGSALVRVNRIGVCGTDQHAYRGRQPFFTYPRILGHELAVTVEEVNDPASELKAGDRCAVEPYLNCGQCIACRRGRSNCCASLKVLGVHIDGGMCEQIVVPANKLHRSTVLAMDQLALVEPLGIGCHAVERAAIEAGENVLILGAGPIGLSIIPFAMSRGGNVICADVVPSRLEFCRQMGAPQTVEASGEDFVDRLKAAGGGELPTCVLDATGNAQSMARCFDLAAPGGRIVFVGLFPGQLTFDDPNFHRRELTLLASRNSHGSDFRRIISMLETRQIDTAPWITHRAQFAAVVEAFPTWLTAESGVLKAIIEL